MLYIFIYLFIMKEMLYNLHFNFPRSIISILRNHKVIFHEGPVYFNCFENSLFETKFFMLCPIFSVSLYTPSITLSNVFDLNKKNFFNITICNWWNIKYNTQSMIVNFYSSIIN